MPMSGTYLTKLSIVIIKSGIIYEKILDAQLNVKR